MSKNRKIFCSAVFFAAVALLSGCTVNSPLPEDYYAGVDKIAGGNPPSVPVVTLTKSQLRLDYTAAIDPESNAEVTTYFLYFYNGVPNTYYLQRDVVLRIDSPATRVITLNTPSDGVHTAIITGYDGFRESAVTDQNRIIFSWP